MKAVNSDARQMLTSASMDLYLRILDGVQPTAADDMAELLANELVVDLGAGIYEALDADVAVRRWQTNLHAMGTRLLAESQAVPEQLRDLAQAYRRARPAAGSGVEHIRGTASINDRMRPVVENCTSELLTAQPSGPRPAHVLVMSYERDLAVLDRGAAMRTMYLPTVRSDAPTARWAQTLTAAGAQIRTAWDVARVVIVDRHTAVAPVIRRGDVADAGSVDEALFITNESVVQLLVATFERDWARADPWDGVRMKVSVTAEQRRILQLSAQGMEGDQVCERLGIARRTLANRLAELREMAGAANMAQLMYWWGRRADRL